MTRITKYRFAALLAFSLFIPFCASAQTPVLSNAIGIDVRYTSSSQVFLYPFSSTPERRNETAGLGGFLSYSGHYSRKLSESIEVQICGEYIHNKSESTDNYGTITSDGFLMYGIDALGVFYMPFSSETVQFYAGGGGSVVFGSREYSIAGAKALSINSGTAFGIHILFGIEYFLTRTLSLRGEFHFRDPQITVTNAFSQDHTESNGITYYLPAEPFDAKLNLNGNVYSIGLSWHW